MSAGLWEGLQSLFGASPEKLVAKSQGLIEKARQREETNPREAIKLYTKAIETLSKVPAVGDQRALLGSALLSRGKLQEAQGDRATAVESYLRAKQVLPSIPLPVLSFIGATLAAGGDLKAPAVQIYLELVRALRDQEKPPEARAVYALLEKHCAVEEQTGGPEALERFGRLQRVVEADPKLEWGHYYMGLVYFSRKRYEEALGCFQRAMALHCSKPRLGFCLAFCQGRRNAQRGQPQAAVEAFRQAASQAPERPEPEFEAGKLLLEMSRKAAEEDPERARWLQEAVHHLGRAVELGPQQAEYAFCLGWAQELAGTYTEAAAALERAIRLDATKAEYFLHLGRCRQALGAYQEAQAAARSALALDRQYLEARRLLAEASLAAEEFEQAAGEFRAVVSADPGDAGARLGLGLALYALNRFEEAAQALEPVYALSDAAAFRLGRCYAQLGQYEKAVERLAELSSKQPGNAETLYYLALAHAHLDCFEAAIQAFGQAIQAGGSQPDSHLQRGNACFKLGRYQQAAADYRKALELRAGDPQVLFQLGCLYAQTGEDDEAISQFSRATLLAPTHLPARLALGALHEKQGAFDKALSDYRAAAKLEPKNALVRRRLGVVRCRLEQYDKALGELRQATALGDTSDELLYYLGLAAARREDYAGAIAAWEKLCARQPGDQRLALNANRLHYELGKQHAAAGRLEEAIVEWNLYLKPRPDDEQMKREIGKLHFRLALAAYTCDGRNGAPAARVALRHALTLDPDNATYRYYLALCDALEGDWKVFTAAAQGLLPQLDAKMQPVARCHLGIACLAQNDLENAERYLAAVRAEPGRAGVPVDICWPLAVVYAKSGRWAEAADLLCAEAAAPPVT
jgi:tetratricopeptide (TPR) repeat protein